MATNPNYRRWRRIFIWSMFVLSFMGLYLLFEEKLVKQTGFLEIPISIQIIEYITDEANE